MEEWGPICRDHGRWLWSVRLAPDTSQSAYTTFWSTSSNRSGTGGASLIQTVGSSSDTSCLTADISSMSSFFTLNPAIPSQCSPQPYHGILHTGNHLMSEDLSLVASLLLSIIQRRTVRHKRSGTCIFEKTHEYFSRPASSREPKYFGRWRCKDESAHHSHRQK